MSVVSDDWSIVDGSSTDDDWESVHFDDTMSISSFVFVEDGKCCSRLLLTDKLFVAVGCYIRPAQGCH